jgi:light-regulated signal transduction histidine kinase (bacteriophytochrome)
MSVLEIATETKATSASAGARTTSPLGPEDGLGLSACQGILQEHRGQISRDIREDGSVRLRVELPSTESAPAKVKPNNATVPVMWQSQPFA